MSSETICVSVVIPAYNASKWLASTLESVLCQQGVSIEVIVVDDGSTDETSAVVAGFWGVHYIYKENGGQASARNLCIKRARGEFVAFIDADDVWFPGKLAAQVKFMRAGNWEWCYCDGIACDQVPEKILYLFSGVQAMPRGDILEKLLVGNFIPSPSPVVRRAVFGQVGGFNEHPSFKNREDWEMWLRIAEYYPIAYLPENYFCYRLHSENSTRTEDYAKALSSKLLVISEAVARNPDRLGALALQARAHQAINSAKASLKAGKMLTARSIARQMLAEQPINISAYVLWLLSYVNIGLLRRLIDLKNSSRARSKKPGPEI